MFFIHLSKTDFILKDLLTLYLFLGMHSPMHFSKLFFSPENVFLKILFLFL